MENLSDYALVEAYIRAVEIKLDEDFITLLSNELIKRQIVLPTYDRELKAAISNGRK